MIVMQNCRVVFSIVFFLMSGVFYAQNLSEELTTSINGAIQSAAEANPAAMVSSENGAYWCSYEVLAVTDEIRELGDFKFYHGNDLLFVLDEVPGSDMEISNSGFIVFYDHSRHFEGKLRTVVYSPEGNYLFDKTFTGATLFGFSPSGKLFGVGTPEGITLIALQNGGSYIVERGLGVAIDEKDELVAVAPPQKLLIYKSGKLLTTISTSMELPRRVIVSSVHGLAGVVDKRNLRVYSLSDNHLLFENRIGGDLSYRDLKMVEGKIVAGIHKRNNRESTGLLWIYDIDGVLLNQKRGEQRLLRQLERINLPKESRSGYDPVPWPFFPFDSMRTVWNHYEQHMGAGGISSYLHQGLDLITPIGEPTYSVTDGYVKLVLTTGGSLYWRTAVSPTQVEGLSDGWLSAHLIQSTIQVDIGDTVQMHDYLGDIIQWSSNWGHIHFVQIKDSGLVWLYNDNEWGINFNPALALQPWVDSTPPYIDPVFTWSKFAFAVNESAVYLDPDSLFGEIDIIVKVVDYVPGSQWQQPAFTTWYTVKRVSDGQIIKPRTLGHILNHQYSFYASTHYQDYAGVMYQRDATLPPSGWMSMQRNFYHNLTNSDGDSLVDLSEKALSFNTANYPDGDYRIIIEVYDEAGNFDIDSMDVKFKNGNPQRIQDHQELPHIFALDQNYPNPFNPATSIAFRIPRASSVKLVVYNQLGQVVAHLVDEELPGGSYSVDWNAEGVSSGVYYYRLSADDFVQTRKLVLLK